MFEKIEKKTLGYSLTNPLSYNNDYESVTQFVRLNKNIPQNMEKFESSLQDQIEIQQLLTSIREGDLNHPVFSNPNCQLYSLYLLKLKQIDIDDFLTVNIYLCTLMQYTDKQE